VRSVKEFHLYAGSLAHTMSLCLMTRNMVLMGLKEFGDPNLTQSIPLRDKQPLHGTIADRISIRVSAQHVSHAYKISLSNLNALHAYISLANSNNALIFCGWFFLCWVPRIISKSTAGFVYIGSSI
jgi:hypothetical protein